MQTMFIVMFIFAEGIPPKKRLSLAFFLHKMRKKKNPNNPLIALVST